MYASPSKGLVEINLCPAGSRVYYKLMNRMICVLSFLWMIPFHSWAKETLDLRGAMSSPLSSQTEALPKEEVRQILARLNIELTFDTSFLNARDMVAFPLRKPDAYILKPYEMNRLDGQYSLVMSVDNGQRCYQEVQVVTLRSRSYSSLQSLEGKRIALDDKRPSVVFLQGSPVKYHEIFMTTDQKKRIDALTTGKVDALITIVNRLPGRDDSLEFGDQSRDENFSQYRVSHVTDHKIPCWGIALRRGIPNNFLSKLLLFRKNNPQIGRRLLKTIGNFEDLHHVNYLEWIILREKMGRTIYRQFKFGELDLKVKPL